VNGGGLGSEILEHLIDGLDVLVCGLDADGRILHSNRSCEMVTGFERSELRGRRWLEIFARTERHQRIRELWAQAVAGATTAPFEALCRNERRIRWRFSHWKFGLRDEDGLCAFGVDITDDRAELARARAAERTVAVAHLARGLAHEIRNPLNSAKLQLDLAERQIISSRPERATDSVQRASCEILRANAMLTDFLVFARPLKVDLAPVDLRRVALEAKEGAAAKRSGAGEIQLEPGPAPIIDADDDLVGIAIEHLVTNALDAAAMNRDGGRVVLRVLVERNAACLEVEDDGPGLPSPETPIFDAFFTTKPASTGLGLAIVQRVAFDHGGSVSYARRNDRTVFTLRLPFVFGASVAAPD
jgi:PAS domain S-box-containing protein